MIQNPRSKTILCVIMFLFFCNNCIAKEIPVTLDHRIKTYIYNPSDVFPIQTHYGYITHIDLNKNEVIKDIVTGDRSSWTINILYNNMIFIQPHEEDAHTNMTVITNRNVYEFDLFSTKIKEEESKINKKISYAIKFYHPEYAEAKIESYYQDMDETNKKASDQMAIDILLNKDTHYKYSYSGTKELHPMVTFSDKKLTYFKFADNEKIPIIYEMVKTKNSTKKRILDIIEYNGFIIIDSPGKEFLLKEGKLEARVIKQ